jgi:hypothetical protein
MENIEAEILSILGETSDSVTSFISGFKGQDKCAAVLEFLTKSKNLTLSDMCSLLCFVYFESENYMKVVSRASELMASKINDIQGAIEDPPDDIMTDVYLARVREVTSQNDISKRDLVILRVVAKMNTVPGHNALLMTLMKHVKIETFVGAVMLLDDIDCRGHSSWYSAEAIEAVLENIKDQVQAHGRDAAMALASAVMEDRVYPKRPKIMEILNGFLGEETFQIEDLQKVATVNVDHNKDLDLY